MRKVDTAFGKIGRSREEGIALVQGVGESASSEEPLRELKRSVLRLGVDDDGSLERYLLLVAALRGLEALPAVPVGRSVQVLFCEAFQNLTRPTEADRGLFTLGKARFDAMCKVVTLRRFPAGEFDWEVSGIPRSWVLKVDRVDLPRFLWMVAARLRGFAPTFVSHLGLFRKTRAMSKEENDRSFYRMAEAMALQPEIRGWSGSSWMRSPETHRVSPNLAWINQTILANGGMVTNIGPANPDGGILTRSETRRRAYEAGDFKPTEGLGIWPRRAMLAWAAAHPKWKDELPFANRSASGSGSRATDRSG